MSDTVLIMCSSSFHFIYSQSWHTGYSMAFEFNVSWFKTRQPFWFWTFFSAFCCCLPSMYFWPTLSYLRTFWQCPFDHEVSSRISVGSTAFWNKIPHAASKMVWLFPFFSSVTFDCAHVQNKQFVSMDFSRIFQWCSILYVWRIL